MSAATAEEVRYGVLCDGAERVLQKYEMHSTLAPRAVIVSIHDCDGEFVAAVTRDINGADLQALITYGQRMLQLGQRLGENRIADGIRALINAAPLEPTR